MVSIFSNNCIAGFLYNDYKVKFGSPTINLQLTPIDFIKFCSKVDFYLSLKLEENLDVEFSEDQFALISNVKIDKQFPVGKLGDILIFFQHYKNFKEAESKWEERKKRITWDNIYIILNYFNYDHFKCHAHFDLIYKGFRDLKFPNKIFIHSIKDRINLQEKEFVYIPKIEVPWYSHIANNKNNIKVYQIYDFKKWFFDSNTQNIKTQELTSKAIQNKDNQIMAINNEKQKLIDEKSNLQTQINQLQNTLNTLPIKKQQLEISNLEQDLINKKLQTKQLERQLGLVSNDAVVSHGNKITIIHPNSAKSRIQNQLSYKLGQAMIINSKSLLGYIRMPFVLSYIKDKHKQEQKIYQEKIKKDPSLKLPPLENYPDYKEALKLKNHLSYKLGQALIEANKTWYKGGYVKIWFGIRKLKRKVKKDK